jgi:flagellar basal-body rod protein FlgF
MQNALLVGLSRQMALSHELDVIANNLANVDTGGFKADNASFTEYLMPGARDNEFSTGKDRRVSFVEDRATWIDFSAGTTQHTGNPLDVAIDGKGYLVVQTARGQRYTRNGALTLNAAGELVTMSGDVVQGTNGPIVLQSTDRDIIISPTGLVSVRDGTGGVVQSAPRGQLQIVNFTQPQQLQKDGAAMFAAPANVNPVPASPNTRVVQGSLEKSNVRPIMEMARMMEITRSYSDISNLLQLESEQKKNSLQQLSQAPTS